MCNLVLTKLGFRIRLYLQGAYEGRWLQTQCLTLPPLTFRQNNQFNIAWEIQFTTSPKPRSFSVSQHLQPSLGLLRRELKPYVSPMRGMWREENNYFCPPWQHDSQPFADPLSLTTKSEEPFSKGRTVALPTQLWQTQHDWTSFQLHFSDSLRTSPWIHQRLKSSHRDFKMLSMTQQWVLLNDLWSKYPKD